MPKQQLRVDVPQEIRFFEHSFSENECFVLRREKIHIHPKFSNGYKRDEVISSMPAEMLEISSVNAWSKGKGFAIEFYSELKSRWEREGERLNLPIPVELSFEDHWYKLSDEPTIRQLNLKMTDIYQSFRIDYRVNSQKSFLSEKTPEIVVTANGYELYHKEKFAIHNILSRISSNGKLISLGYQTGEKDSDGEPWWRTIWYWYHFVLPAEVGQKLVAMLRT